VLRAELVPGATVLVEPAPEGAEEDDVKLSIVKPEPKPTPVGVGAEGKEGEEVEGPDEGGVLDQPAVPPPDSAE
jgi:ATP-dependent Clp protease ATP-binding subunit ClpC